MSDLIREATLLDGPRIVEMGRHFRRDTSYEKHLSENLLRMTELVNQLVANKSLLVMERDGRIVGMIGFVIHSHFLSGDLIASEIFWWMEPECRGRGLKLLREMERRGRQAGAAYIQMIAPSDELKRLYEKLDYEFVEATYQRRL